MKLYVDGQEEGTPCDISDLRQKLDRYFVGSASGDGMGYFEGAIAEVRRAASPVAPLRAPPLSVRTPNSLLTLSFFPPHPLTPTPPTPPSLGARVELAVARGRDPH